MKPDPLITAGLWLKQSERDLSACWSLLRDGLYEQACFYSQQSAEKALKALAYLRGARLVLGHSVRELLEQLKNDYPALERFQEAAQRLDLVYTTSRYPNTLPGSAPYQVFSQSQAEEVVKMAGAIIDEIKSTISQQTQEE